MNSSIQWHALNLVSLNESSLISDSKSSLYMNPKWCNLTSDENKHMHINYVNLCIKARYFGRRLRKVTFKRNLFPLIKIVFILSSDGLTEVFTRGLFSLIEHQYDYKQIICVHRYVATYCASNLTCIGFYFFLLFFYSYLYRGLILFLNNLNSSF